MQKLVWVTSWDRVCGIADYSKVLWPKISAHLKEKGIEPYLVSLDEFPDAQSLLSRLKDLSPDLIHFQHEYGLYGGKNPPKYWFPRLVRQVRQALPSTRLIATAHTILPIDYRFPVEGRSWQIPVRALANLVLLPQLRKIWNHYTWGPLDRVIVHSSLQVGTVKTSGLKSVQSIPHFVPEWKELPSAPPSKTKRVLVFGFFTREKGQDVAIRAIASLKAIDVDSKVQLILAGGSRRAIDRLYQQHCEELISSLGLKDRIQITGFVPNDQVDEQFQKADLVLVPFRETSGSGSLVQAFARGKPVLASDLPLNREIEERQKGALAFFQSENAKDCALKMRALLSDETALQRLRESGSSYAKNYSSDKTALAHLQFYLD